MDFGKYLFSKIDLLNLANDEDVTLEAILCTEIPLIVLDTLELVIRVVSVLGSDYLFYVLPSVLKVLVSLSSLIF